VAKTFLETSRAHATIHISAMQCTARCCTAIFCTAFFCTALFCTALYCTALFSTALFCTAIGEMYDGKNQLNQSDDGEGNMNPK